jgi:ADP-ribosyl-[dinitrogen reductase] hydrolase
MTTEYPISPRLGVLLAQAVGDALGAGTEFQSPGQIKQKYGTVTGYVQGVNSGFAPGEFTDDTHMALCILGGYWDAQVSGDDLLESTLRRFQGWRDARPPDIGNTTSSALAAARDHGLSGGLHDWERSGFSAAGNGALMRASASIVAGSRGQALRDEAVQLAMLTHPDPRSLAACWLFVVVLEALLEGAEPAAAWRGALDEGTHADLSAPVYARLGEEAGALLRGHLPKGWATVRAAVEHGLTGEWRSQSGYVVDTLEAAVAASLAPSFLVGILPIVARGDDSDTVGAIAGALLGARGLLPPAALVDDLRCRYRWPTWPTGQERALAALAAFVPPLPGLVSPAVTDADPEAQAAYQQMFGLPQFEYDEIAPNVYAGRAPTFRRDVWRLRAQGVTHLLDLREPHEWSGSGRVGNSAIHEIERLGVARLSVPVADMGASRLDDLDRAVAFMAAALHVGGTVYIHCRAGMERTAAVAAAWFAEREACTIYEAVDRLRQRRPIFAPLHGQVRAAEAWLMRRREP